MHRPRFNPSQAAPSPGRELPARRQPSHTGTARGPCACRAAERWETKPEGAAAPTRRGCDRPARAPRPGSPPPHSSPVTSRRPPPRCTHRRAGGRRRAAGPGPRRAEARRAAEQRRPAGGGAAPPPPAQGHGVPQPRRGGTAFRHRRDPDAEAWCRHRPLTRELGGRPSSQALVGPPLGLAVPHRASRRSLAAPRAAQGRAGERCYLAGPGPAAATAPGCGIGRCRPSPGIQLCHPAWRACGRGPPGPGPLRAGRAASAAAALSFPRGEGTSSPHDLCEAMREQRGCWGEGGHAVFLRGLARAGFGGHVVARLAGRLAGVGRRGRAPGRAVRLPRPVPRSSRPERLAPRARAGPLPVAAGRGGPLRMAPLHRQPPRYSLRCPGASVPPSLSVPPFFVPSLSPSLCRALPRRCCVAGCSSY